MTFELIYCSRGGVPLVRTRVTIEAPTFFLARAALCALKELEPDDVRLAEPRRYA